MTIVDAILQFWFGTLENDHQLPEEKSQIWFKKSDPTDQLIRDQFEAELLQAIKSTENWENTPRGTLALIILFDQFSRNLYRDSAKAFAQDPQAIALSLQGLEAEMDQALRPIERLFFYMPLMHSEMLENQKKCLRCFENLLENSPPELKEWVTRSLQSAHQHCEIIERFGRFPHRNQALGRVSTPEEEQFLEQPGSRF